MRCAWRLVSWAALLFASRGACAQTPLRIALTFDDLPWSGPSVSAAERRDGIARIIATLRAHRAPATGFVNCSNVRGDTAILRAWLAAGLALDNHTARHTGIDAVGASAWLSDVRACDRMLRAWGVTPRFLRFPMLRQGATLARRDSGARGLAALGYRTAHVTIDNADYIVADGYHRARLAGNEQAALTIATLFAEHIRACTLHAQRVALRKFRRAVPHVLLLHATRLNAEQLDALLQELRRDGAEFIALNLALQDSLYARPDRYVGARGLSWLYRIAPTDTADAAWDDRETARVEAILAKLVAPPNRR